MMQHIADEVLAEANRQARNGGYPNPATGRPRCGQLSMAASLYARNASTWLTRQASGGITEAMRDRYPDFSPMVLNWPWSEEHWQPTSPRDDLIRAAAMILAEIEFLDAKTAEAVAAGNSGVSCRE